MKKALLLLLTLIGLSQAVAQEYEYVPFVREGVKWTYYIYNYNYDEYNNPAQGCNIVYRTLELKGDTVINGKTFKAMHKYGGDAINEEKDTIPVYLREEGKRVYGIIPDRKGYDDCPVYNHIINVDTVVGGINTYCGEEFLLYDFQDPVAFWDSVNNVYSLNTYSQLQMDYIAVGNHLAKRYSGQIRREYQLIEGIGQIALNSTPLYFPAGIQPYIYAELYGLEKVVENGEVIYPQNFVNDRYLPLIREGVKWVNEKVTVHDGDTTCQYYTYEFKGNHPVKDNHNRTYKALYRYDGAHHDFDVENDSPVAGLREDMATVIYENNEPLNACISQERDMINFNGWLYTMSTDDLGIMGCRQNYINNQRETFLNHDNFVKAEPIMVDGYRCSRLAYLDEQGDTLAYVVEGIGFDSYDMGDLLTPFTRKPDPEADYQEWCGLSHVVKDGEIIYKGMRYRPDVHVGIDEAVADKTRLPLDENYYDLMGRSVGKEVPVTPGIYIHQGKKVVVR